MEQKKIKARLELEDGSVFHGFSFAACKSVAGEVVFNTSMVGYPESLTDPSYYGQILVLTYPLIGNYGVPDSEIIDGLEKYFESSRVQILGLVVSEYSFEYSHWNAKRSLAQWLIEHEVPALYGIDTRRLTKMLRDEGTMLGRILFFTEEMNFYDPNKSNLVEKVSISKPKEYGAGDNKVIRVTHHVHFQTCPFCFWKFLRQHRFKAIERHVCQNRADDTPLRGACLCGEELVLIHESRLEPLL